MSATSASPISLSDLETADDEPRVKDVRIAERLGMTQPLNIRQTIEANRGELERYGAIFTHRVKNTGRGRSATEYYLNEPQTLLLCMLSRTDRAADVRQEVIEVFMAYRRGELPAQPQRPSVRDMDAARRLVAECRKVYGPLAAQRMWRDLNLPGAPEPDQGALPLAAPEARDGAGMIVLDGNAVYYDATDTAVREGERVLAIIPMGNGRTPSLEVIEPVMDPTRWPDRPHGDRTVVHKSGTDPLSGQPYFRLCTALGRVIAIRPIGRKAG
jgi:molybdopterin synthase catalytic subunit